MKTKSEYTAFVTKNTQLTATGYDIDQFYIYGTPEYEIKWASERAILFDLYPQFVHCLNWLATGPELNLNRSTYSLKGDVERWLKAQGANDHYIPQGAFVLAALSAGYTIAKLQEGGPNVFLKKA